MRLLHAKEWVVYAKRPFGGAQQVFAYLGRYTHRFGLSNQRLDEIGEAGVRFHTKDGKSVTLAPPDFIGRFLLHVLPAGFVKIRHYGLLAAGNVGTKLEVARSLLETPAGESAARAALPCSWQEWLLMLTGQDASRCPLCQTGHVRRRPLAALPWRTLASPWRTPPDPRRPLVRHDLARERLDLPVFPKPPCPSAHAHFRATTAVADPSTTRTGPGTRDHIGPRTGPPVPPGLSARPQYPQPHPRGATSGIVQPPFVPSARASASSPQQPALGPRNALFVMLSST